MNICVCIKVVPHRDDIVFDAEKGTMRRLGTSMCINPGDLVALEAAFLLRQKYGGTIHGVCMGPAAAEPVLQSGFFLGADELSLLSSPCFAGADVASTAYALHCFFAARAPYDLILCGKFSSDGNTGQLGAYLAAMLGLPHLHNVTRIDKADSTTLTAWQRVDGYEQKALTQLPALLVVETDFAQPHTPSLSQTLKAKGKKVVCLDETSLVNLDVERCGLRGAKTRISKVFVPASEHSVTMIPPDKLHRLLPLFERTLT